MRIRPTQTSFAPDGPPPGFRIETDAFRFYAVQVATDPSLFNGALASRRTQANFFDSWYGDDRVTAPAHRPVRREVAGQHLEARAGRATYVLPPVVWRRFRSVTRLYYRLLVFADERRRRPAASFADVDWRRAPAVSIAPLPAQPARSPVSAFRGRNVIERADFLVQARKQLQGRGIISGRDRDWRYAVLDGSCFHMTVLECHKNGLTDTIAAMPRKPDAVINGQFIGSAFGIDTQGQVMREGQLINADSQPSRFYLAQTWRGSDVSDFHVGKGDPSSLETEARVAFGGLGPVLLGGTPVTDLTPWARSVYDRSTITGRGVIAVKRDIGLILLFVQQDSAIYSENSMNMRDLRDLLHRLGFDEAVFNDGSDSESLYAGGGWLLTPGYAKDEAMDFAISFVNRQQNRRAKILAIDGTRTADGEAFVKGVARPLLTHYSPRNLSDDLQAATGLSAIATTFRSGIIQAWRATSQTQANIIGSIIKAAGHGGHWADIFYVSSHAWRHGQLWYYAADDHSNPKLMIADIWSSSFRPIWRRTPRWLILAGCAVLGLRYSRGLKLDAIERGHLVDWHRDIHGPGANVPGLTAARKTLVAVYHPGWAWYHRIFRVSPSLRGVLGYWYRSPTAGLDAKIAEQFTEKLSEGLSFLDAWSEANEGGLFVGGSLYQAEALWAAMVRQGCEGDTLASLEDPALSAATGEFKYFDRFQSGKSIVEAYRYANRLTEADTVGEVNLRFNDEYDEMAIEELEELDISPTADNFLLYNDGVGP